MKDIILFENFGKVNESISGEWVLCADGLPDKEKVGDKVLLYRITNEDQASMSYSIYPTNMVRLCKTDETWWMELPKPPTK